jgi:RIB43A.
MRQRFMERTMKFMDSKQRTIGVDKQSLDKQLVEKKLRLEHDKQQNIKEGKYSYCFKYSAG